MKLMVGVVHECVAHEFEGKSRDLHIHESIVAIGSTRLEAIHGDERK